MILASSSPVSLLLTVAAALAYAIPAVAARQLQDRGARAALWLAWVLHAAVLGWSMLEATPRFGFAPALSVTAWLPLHLALGISAYGLLAAAVVHAALMTRAERRIRLAVDPHSGMPLLTLERLTFRFVTAGFVLLTATLAAGMLFSEALYGRAWRWDHKAVFSVLSWLTFATLLLGRSRFGWRGRSAVRVLYAGAALLLLAYVGSRFALEVVLGRST